MTDFDLRRVPHTDPALAAMSAYAFADSPQPRLQTDARPDGPSTERDSTFWVSYRDGEAVARVGVHPMTMNVRGLVLPMGGVGGVATMPTGRRGGHVRALMQRSFADMREAGQQVSGLYAFRESFYQRLGYVAMTRPRWVSVNPARLAPLLGADGSGVVRHRRLSDAADDWASVQRDVQARTHGLMLPGPAREGAWATHDDQWLVTVHESDRITGAMPYRITENRSTLLAAAFFWTTRAAQTHLLDFVARHVDQVQKARLPLLPGSDADHWATDSDVTITTADAASWGPPMGRIVQMSGLAGIGAGQGRIVVGVTDAHAPWNEGPWTLEGRAGALVVTPGGDPEVTLPIEALGASVFAGLDPSWFGPRGWGKVPDEVGVRLRALFGPVEAYGHALF